MPITATDTASNIAQQIRADSWNAHTASVGVYVIDDATHMSMSANGSGLATLWINAKPVGYLHGSADEQAAAVERMLNQRGNQPTRLTLSGHYGNTVFYIDGVSVAVAPDLAAVIKQIHSESFHSNGSYATRTYVLPKVTSLSIGDGNPLPRLLVDGQRVGYLSLGGAAIAKALQPIIDSRGGVDLRVRGHAANTTFYVDGLDIA